MNNQENEMFQTPPSPETSDITKAPESATGTVLSEITDETPPPASDSDPLLEEIQLKHERNERNMSKEKKESFGDVLVMQITLSVILLLVFAVLNILKPDFVREAIVYFRDMSRGEPEKFFENAVQEVIRIIYAKI